MATTVAFVAIPAMALAGALYTLVLHNFKLLPSAEEAVSPEVYSALERTAYFCLEGPGRLISILPVLENVSPATSEPSTIQATSESRPGAALQRRASPVSPEVFDAKFTIYSFFAIPFRSIEVTNVRVDWPGNCHTIVNE